MAGVVVSLNVGQPTPNRAKKAGVTGIAKAPVSSASLRAPGPKRGGLGSGVVGDFLGDLRHHGGDRQAVYAFAREEYDAWEARLGRPLSNGLFGENLTTSGLDVDAALVGERWSVGSVVVVEVTGPRIPCATFAARMGERGWVRRFSEVGRTGAYLAVVRGGTVRHGDEVAVVSRPDHDIDVPTLFRAFLGEVDALRRVLDADVVDEPDRTELAAKLTARTA